MDFICIDFETANEKRASVCAVALIYFKANDVVDTKEWLVKPPPECNWFNPFNVQIHGITEDDVKDKPEFKDIWPEIRKFITDNKIIVAHNAAFDMSVLRAILDVYDMPYPRLRFVCTNRIAVKTWDKQVNYTLKNIGNMLGYIFNHHDPHDDAKIAGKILIHACEVHEVNSIEALAEKIGMQIGELYERGYSPCSVSNAYRGLGNERVIKISEMTAATSEFDLFHPFYEKKVAFTGTLGSMSRETAMQKVLDVGGQVTNGVTRDTSFLVMGIQDYSKFVDGLESRKTKKAKELIQQGFDLQIINEDDFLRML